MTAVSVVIPTYNRARTLPRTIDSVLAQTFEDFELIVVDDNSTDDTASVVAQYDDPRITFVSHDENRGGSAARNTGIGLAEGEYIAFLDSDDEWLPTKLQRQIDCLESRSEEWVVAYCGYHVEMHGATKGVRNVLKRIVGSNSNDSHGKEGGEELISDVLTMSLSAGSGSTLVVRADAVDEIDGFDQTFERHQDWEFLIRLLHTGKLAYVDEELARIHDSGPPPTDVVERSKRKYLAEFEEEIQRAENAGYDVMSQHRFDLARYLFREGRFREGAGYVDGIEMVYQQNFSLVRCGLTGLIRTIRGAIQHRTKQPS